MGTPASYVQPSVKFNILEEPIKSPVEPKVLKDGKSCLKFVCVKRSCGVDGMGWCNVYYCNSVISSYSTKYSQNYIK